MKSKMKIKKSKIIILSIITLVVAVLAVSAVMNINNIAAVYRFLRYSQDEIQTQLADTKGALLDSIKEYGFTQDIRDFSEEEEKMLAEGKLTPEEAVELLFTSPEENSGITSDTQESTETEDNALPTEDPQNSSGQTSQTSGISNEEFEAQMKEYIKVLYTVKADFTAKLGDVERNIKADYAALDEQDRTMSGKQKIVAKYWNDVVALEKECDKLVNDVVASLKSFLNENDLDTYLCTMIEKYYNEEKELKKAYYMKRLTN